MKNLLLLIIGVAIFIAVIGFSSTRLSSLISKPKEVVIPKKEITVGDTKIMVELADSEAERQKGLSGRDVLNEGEGMLFIFDKDDVFPSFWMKDMKIAIDIIWINDGKVVKIDNSLFPPAEGTPDSQLVLYHPEKGIDIVLEVPAGFSEKNNIKTGDTLTVLTPETSSQEE